MNDGTAAQEGKNATYRRASRPSGPTRARERLPGHTTLPMDPTLSPAEPPPRRSLATADFGPRLRLALRIAGIAFVVTLALVLLDVVAGVRLPGAIRPLLPWLLVLATGAGITLLVGALGMPKRPER